MGSVKDEPQTPFRGERSALTSVDARGVAARWLDRDDRDPAEHEAVPHAGGRRIPAKEFGTAYEMIERTAARRADREDSPRAGQAGKVLVSDLSRRLGL